MIAGSLRKDSYCKHLAEYISQLLPEDFEILPIDIAGIDSFNEDIEDLPSAS